MPARFGHSSFGTLGSVGLLQPPKAPRDKKKSIPAKPSLFASFAPGIIPPKVGEAEEKDLSPYILSQNKYKVKEK
ncbi:hypothetical protein COV42_00830 [Candidatus Campbellbacteria bacterium CG11_big_fil_rev_8_21_14_0_20_44_21]|nr:MAG: hypothetical protein COV42_00830 [Candidatus Campbellbacteria bacterium CG11_big_fil_rev_8_21_14_0_20_44_21]